MCSTLAHAVSASLIALMFAQVKPSETPYVVTAIVSASILDLDHVIYVIRDHKLYRRIGYNGNLHHARSPFHELFGLLVAGIVTVLLFQTDPRLARVVFVAFAIHVVQDWVVGKSHPLAPIDKTEMQFFRFTFTQKLVIDLITIVTFSGLWIAYLYAQN